MDDKFLMIDCRGFIFYFILFFKLLYSSLCSSSMCYAYGEEEEVIKLFFFIIKRFDTC